MANNGYPDRPSVFPIRLSRLLASSEAAMEVGATGCWLLLVIATKEDELFYPGPVAFWNHSLSAQLGLSENAMVAARKRCIDHGWLSYKKGRKGVAPRYFITIPKHCETQYQMVCTAISEVKSEVKAKAKAEGKAEGKARNIPPNPIPDPKPKKKRFDPTELALPFKSESFRSAWEGFCQNRREIKKPFTQSAAIAALKRLGAMGNERAVAALIHSTANQWQGIFEPKGNDMAPSPEPRRKQKPIDARGARYQLVKIHKVAEARDWSDDRCLDEFRKRILQSPPSADENATHQRTKSEETSQRRIPNAHHNLA